VPLSAVDWSYFAGIIDGEGCIRFGTAPRLHVTNTDKRLIDWLYQSFGGYMWTETKQYAPNAKIRHVWEVSSLKCRDLLVEVLPYLRLKHEQAEAVIAYYEGRGRLSRPGEREALKARLHMLNKKGAA
jgi:hypothetical protein